MTFQPILISTSYIPLAKPTTDPVTAHVCSLVEISKALIRHVAKTAKTLASANESFAWHRVRSIGDAYWLVASRDRRVGALHFMLIWTCDDVIG
jgi:hypothetical protein